jgi:SNF2 family DNA or RNA helicase
MEYTVREVRMQRCYRIFAVLTHERHLRPGALSWIRFHRAQKQKILSLGRYDIVITTFETLVRQHKAHIDVSNIEDTLLSFSWHRIVLDEGNRLSGPVEPKLSRQRI